MSDRTAPIVGLFGAPYVDLGHLIGAPALAEVDEEITRGLVRVETSYTGGSLKWMGVVAPWLMDDGYRDLMFAVEAMTRAERAELAELAEDPSSYDLDGALRVGDETDHPLNRAQQRWLALRHDVYFPWKVCYHLLENDRWEDKHSGHPLSPGAPPTRSGKDFSDEAKAIFPKTLELVRALPFTEIGRAVIFGLEPNDHAPLHRDSEPGKALAVAQSISIDPRGNKRFYVNNHADDEPLVIDAQVYWFNDMDYHGVLPDPFFRYSMRVDGVFEPAFLRDVERRARLGPATGPTTGTDR